MRKEIYTVAIMSFAGQPMRTFSISRASMIIISIFVVIIGTSSISFGFLKIWNTYQKQTRETQSAIQKYELLQKDFKKLQIELANIKESCQDFKNLLGVDISNASLRKSKPETSALSGKGGPEETDLAYDDLNSPDEIINDLKADMSFAMMEAMLLRSDINDLIRDANSKLTRFSTTPSICPVWVDLHSQYSISSGFGYRISPFTGLLEYHQGLDIPAITGTPVMATADGTVVVMGQSVGYGNYVVIRHDDKYSTVYGHLNSFASYAGAKIKRYDIIGYVGSTGRSTGSHLHYEVRDCGQRVNPFDYILN
jgi:murein DD-endopeptidase MepM/ murein hydrolase activator NlpD